MPPVDERTPGRRVGAREAPAAREFMRWSDSNRCPKRSAAPPSAGKRAANGSFIHGLDELGRLGARALLDLAAPRACLVAARLNELLEPFQVALHLPIIEAKYVARLLNSA